MNPLVIGTRGSALAMWQAGFVRDALVAARPGLQVRLRVIRTRGDQSLQAETGPAGDRGLFTLEIERELLAGSVGLAVHSLKDLPIRLPEGLVLAALLRREDPADVVVSKDGAGLAALAPGATVLTGSARRRAQLLHRRRDLKVLPVRGNVPTRLRKLDASDAQAVILARAGLVRLGLAGRIAERLEPAEFVPACGQGALAVEVRADNAPVRGLLAALDDPQTRAAVTAERAFLAELGAGCRAPAGAYARPDDHGAALVITGLLASPDGSRLLRETMRAPLAGVDEAAALGRSLAGRLCDQGAREILDEVAGQSPAAPETGT